LKCTGDLPSPRIAHSAFYGNRGVYILGGYDGIRYLNDMYFLSIEKNEQDMKFDEMNEQSRKNEGCDEDDCVSSRNHFFCHWRELKIGISKDTPHAIQHIAWPEPRAYAHVITSDLQKSIYVYGGKNSFGVLSNIYRFDLTTLSWMRVSHCSSFSSLRRDAVLPIQSRYGHTIISPPFTFQLGLCPKGTVRYHAQPNGRPHAFDLSCNTGNMCIGVPLLVLSEESIEILIMWECPKIKKTSETHQIDEKYFCFDSHSLLTSISDHTSSPITYFHDTSLAKSSNPCTSSFYIVSDKLISNATIDFCLFTQRVNENLINLFVPFEEKCDVIETSNYCLFFSPFISTPSPPVIQPQDQTQHIQSPIVLNQQSTQKSENVESPKKENNIIPFDTSFSINEECVRLLAQPHDTSLIREKIEKQATDFTLSFDSYKKHYEELQEKVSTLKQKIVNGKEELNKILQQKHSTGGYEKKIDVTSTEKMPTRGITKKKKNQKKAKKDFDISTDQTLSDITTYLSNLDELLTLSQKWAQIADDISRVLIQSQTLPSRYEELTNEMKNYQSEIENVEKKLNDVFTHLNKIDVLFEVGINFMCFFVLSVRVNECECMYECEREYKCWC
jgi:hypothetical protein